MADVAAVVAGLAAVDPAPSAVSIGFFDGVHRGHQEIIRRAADRGRDAGVRSVVVTFDRHPMEVVRPGTQPRLLMTLPRRVRTLAMQGVDLVVVLPFDDELRHSPPDAFVERILAGPLAARAVVVGDNFRYGHRAEGDIETLTATGRRHGFATEGVPLLEVDGTPVSSTEIRAAVEAGDVARAATLLGRPHLVDGVVVRGDQRGVGLGFPTANVQVDPRTAVPARGVYAGVFTLGRPDQAGTREADGSDDPTVDDRRHPCVTNVGVNPTFGGNELRVEAHLLDADLDLYGAAAAVDFRHRLRGEVRFESVDALVAQVRADADTARRLLVGA